jgi:hypothetical protein
MTLPLSQRAQLVVGSNVKEPNIVLEIEGISTLYGAIIIKTDVKVGDIDLEVGDPVSNPNAFYVGDLREVSDQDNAISMSGTSQSIRQMLQIDIGQGSSISNMSIALIDSGDITKLITPGQLIDDILQARCKVYLGFSDVSWPKDYVVIFRGIVTDVTSDAGKIILMLNHPDDKKQGSIFKSVKPKLVGNINSVTTTINLDSVNDLLVPVLGPDGTYDPSFQAYVLIDSEAIGYTGVSGLTLTGVTRGGLLSIPASHSDGTAAETIYQLTGNCIDLALKIMCSNGVGGFYASQLDMTSFNNIDTGIVQNAIYFNKTNLVDKYNVAVGDFITTIGASNGANNVSLQPIIDIIDTPEGQYLVIGGTAFFVTETGTSALLFIRSQYDTLPDGLALTNDEVDLDEHLHLQDIFLGGFSYDFRLKETIDDARKFLETEIYSPVAAFSLPRKSRCSVGYHIGPIPGQYIKTFDASNIKNPSKQKLVRSTNRNFYNEIVYEFDQSFVTGEFISGLITISETSKAQIKGYNKTLTIKSKGLRSSTGAASIAHSQSNRRLSRYQFAAEMLSFGTSFSDGFNVEIGDIVWIDGSQLKMPDIKTALKGMAGRYFFVQNKTLNFKGDIQFDFLDTNFLGTGRYGLQSPSSQVLSGTSTTEFTIGQSYSHKFGVAEHKKWSQLVGAKVIVRSPNYSVSAETIIQDASTNVIQVLPALPFVPATGYVMEFVIYPDQVLELADLIYVAMSNVDFIDGKKQFVQL